MNQTDVVEIVREAITVLIAICAPTMLVGLIVGVVVSLLQALTQIQEMTLSFVPKILAVFLTLIVTMPFMISSLIGITQRLMDRVVDLDKQPQ